jgi:6-pyruvoyltetrahydropterin/6-carboxytetrahydropterin synthase
MHQLTIQHVFSAAHAITIRGEREPIHGHDWHTTVVICAETLDEDGLVCDFHAVEEILRGVCGPFHNRSLNDTPPFDTLNPTAEHVARYVAEELAARLDEALPVVRAPLVRVERVSVTEAPGCAATFIRDA